MKTYLISQYLIRKITAGVCVWGGGGGGKGRQLKLMNIIKDVVTCNITHE